MKSNSACETCGSTNIRFEGTIDSNRVHNPANPYPFGRSDIPVTYNKCRDCKFLFSRDWALSDPSFFSEYIYNDDYKKIVDPDWTENRALQVAPLFVRLLNILKNKFRPSLLDYGGGSGLLAYLLAEDGALDTITYDPYTTDNQLPEERVYNVIVAIEVFEHEISPSALIKNMSRLLSDDGIIFFTTKTFRNPTVTHSYVAPRNGHVSIYSPNALRELGAQRGFYYRQLVGGLLHLYSREKLGFYDFISLSVAVAYEKTLWVSWRISNKFFRTGHD